MCMCVCIYIYICVAILYIYMCVCIYIYICVAILYIYIYVCVRVCVYIYIYVCVPYAVDDIYIQREREIGICIFVCLYIFTMRAWYILGWQASSPLHGATFVLLGNYLEPTPNHFSAVALINPIQYNTVMFPWVVASVTEYEHMHA